MENNPSFILSMNKKEDKNYNSYSRTKSYDYRDKKIKKQVQLTYIYLSTIQKYKNLSFNVDFHSFKKEVTFDIIMF